MYDVVYRLVILCEINRVRLQQDGGLVCTCYHSVSCTHSCWYLAGSEYVDWTWEHNEY